MGRRKERAKGDGERAIMDMDPATGLIVTSRSGDPAPRGFESYARGLEGVRTLAADYRDAESIVRHEEAGARAVAAATLFPSDVMRPDAASRKAAMERMGIKFLGPVKDDPLFVRVELPEGWKFAPSPEDYRTNLLLDPKGRARGYFWYKAASYDRAAYSGLYTRYSVRDRTFNDYRRSVVYVTDRLDVKNENRVVFQAETTFESDRAYFKASDDGTTRKAAIEFLDKTLPDWTDPCAYWDDPDLPTVGEFPPWNQR